MAEPARVELTLLDSGERDGFDLDAIPRILGPDSFEPHTTPGTVVDLADVARLVARYVAASKDFIERPVGKRVWFELSLDQSA